MHASVTDALFEALPRHGIATVRFNFRGVGASGGEHDHGLGERLDIVAAIELLSMFVDGPLVLVGLLVRRRRLAVRLRPADRRLVRGRSAAAHRARPPTSRRRPILDRSTSRSPSTTSSTRRTRHEPPRPSGATTEVTCIPGRRPLPQRAAVAASPTVASSSRRSLADDPRTVLRCELRHIRRSSRHGPRRRRHRRRGGRVRRPTQLTVTCVVKSGGYGAVTVRAVKRVVARRHRERAWSRRAGP